MNIIEYRCHTHGTVARRERQSDAIGDLQSCPIADPGSEPCGEHLYFSFAKHSQNQGIATSNLERVFAD